MYQLHQAVFESGRFFEPGLYLDDELPEWAQKEPFATECPPLIMSKQADQEVPNGDSN